MSIAKFYPFNGARGRLRLGLNVIEFSDWLQYENDFSERIKQKKKLTKELGKQVVDTLPASLDAQKEFLEVLLDHLQQHQANRFDVSVQNVSIKNKNKSFEIADYEHCPIELASYLVADDFCLLEEEGDDYKLTAASVCAPTWWSLPEKLGKPLTSIHAPIDGLEEKIGRMIRHFLHNLKVKDCYQRSNWFLFSSKEYCVFPGSFDFQNEMSNINDNNIEESLFLRSERQTFRRLEKTNAIAFGIKVYVEPISVVKDYPAIANDLMVALNSMDKDQKYGLGITFVEIPLRTYLSKVLNA